MKSKWKNQREVELNSLWGQQDGHWEVGGDEGSQLRLQPLSEAREQGVASSQDDVLVEVRLHL